MSKIELPNDPAVSFRISNSKTQKAEPGRVFRAVLFTIARKSKLANIPRQMAGQENTCIQLNTQP